MVVALAVQHHNAGREKGGEGWRTPGREDRRAGRPARRWTGGERGDRRPPIEDPKGESGRLAPGEEEGEGHWRTHREEEGGGGRRVPGEGTAEQGLPAVGGLKKE